MFVRCVVVDSLRLFSSYPLDYLGEVRKALGESDVCVDWADPQARMQRSLEGMLMALAEFAAPSRMPTNERAKRCERIRGYCICIIVLYCIIVLLYFVSEVLCGFFFSIFVGL
jgi:hypothetical protein